VVETERAAARLERPGRAADKSRLYG